MEASHLARQIDQTDAQPEPHERRHGGRIDSSGTALVHGACCVHGRIVDLSVGGLSLLVDPDVATPAVETRVHVDLRLDGRGHWLHLIGSVVRVDARGSATALVIKLLAVPPDFEDLVQDELLSALECARQPQILLVDAARGRRELVADAFRATGCRVIEVSSPLAAIIAIDQSRLHLRAVVIADTDLVSRAEELREFLRETYPGVPLIVVGEHHRARMSQLSVDGFPDLALQVHDLVGMSGQLDGLR